MFSVAAPHAKGKCAEDNIFAANNRAIALVPFWMKMEIW